MTRGSGIFKITETTKGIFQFRTSFRKMSGIYSFLEISDPFPNMGHHFLEGVFLEGV